MNSETICLNFKSTTMKKIYSLLLILSIMCVFSSCSEKEVVNPLIGTLWCHNFQDFYMEYIEFIDDRNIQIWNDHDDILYKGTYTVTGDFVSFSNLVNLKNHEIYLDGYYTNHNLRIRYKSGYNYYYTNYIKK